MGALILHGILYGQILLEVETKQKKGHRIFCSNRNRRQGCGKTFPLRMATVIRSTSIKTQQLRTFLQNLCSGTPIIHALEIEPCYYSTSSRYRLYHKFKRRQPAIRTKLSELSRPPTIHESKNPLLETFEHLKAAFKDAPCCIAAFQNHFQTSIL